jgi:hypothetical protein
MNTNPDIQKISRFTNLPVVARENIGLGLLGSALSVVLRFYGGNALGKEK